jgi:hypothetical protein
MTRQQARRRGLAWPAGLTVALGAGVATAHGLFEVTVAARVPAPIACLYPLITDGLALVAYAATSRLRAGGRRYAWSVVVLAAGLSGLAQAAYLSGDVGASTALRFGVGAWPAIAAAIVAHLLHLLTQSADATEPESAPGAAVDPPTTSPAVQPGPVQPQPRQPVSVHSVRVQPEPGGLDAVQPPPVGWTDPAAVQPWPVTVQPAGQSAADNGPRPAAAGDRAREVAWQYQQTRGRLPTTSELAAAAEVARGTAGNVLKALRAEGPALHLIHDSDQPRHETSTDR